MSNPQAPLVAAPTDPENIKKAQAFFERAVTVGQTGNHEYAIDTYIHGLMIHPEAMDTIKALAKLRRCVSPKAGRTWATSRSGNFRRCKARRTG